MTDTSLSKTTTSFSEWSALKEQANILLKSGFLPKAIDTPEKAIAIALKGRELGIGAMEALNNINVILGKPCVSPQLMLALARRTGQLEHFAIESSPEGAKIEVKRRGTKMYVGFFGVEQAKKLGLMGKDNYTKQPEVMFKWRVIAEAMRFIFPDAIAGLYTPDEMGVDVSVTEMGDMEIKGSLPKVQTPKETVDMKTGEVIETLPVQKDLPPPEQSAEFISEKQRGLLFARIKSRNIDPEVFKAYLTSIHGVSSTTKVTKEQMPIILQWIDDCEVGA